MRNDDTEATSADQAPTIDARDSQLRVGIGPDRSVRVTGTRAHGPSDALGDLPSVMSSISERWAVPIARINEKLTTAFQPMAQHVLPNIHAVSTSPLMSALAASRQFEVGFFGSAQFSGDLYRASIAIQDALKHVTLDLDGVPVGPPNWPFGLSRRLEAQAIIQNDGIPLVWVPRPDIVADLCDAADFQMRAQIIGERAAEIMEDCRKCLAEIPSGGRMPALVSGTNEAVDAFLAGFPGSGQSHADNLLDSALRNMERQGAAFGRLAQFGYKCLLLNRT